MIIVELANPLDPAPSALLATAQALQAEIYAEENNHALDTNALCAQDIRFFSAREGDEILGVGAVKLHVEYGEIKSMFTAANGRGKGIAAAIMRMIEDTVKSEGITALKLETGDELAAAVRLYERFGFVRCAAFGDYIEDGCSVFMEKSL